MLQKTKEFIQINKKCVHEEDEDGKTALHCAAKYGFSHITLLLIENGAKINALVCENFLFLHTDHFWLLNIKKNSAKIMQSCRKL